ncbi:MAG: hypothetical protein WAP20_01515 [Limnochordia bacterium]|nr:hypothetical protein [Bacillota bacterium]HOB09637.1 hypothetical protein [Limnochordia bacterium]NLH31792.1 hypothetical protein [Bacillota bacterium]HPT93552.1 hypothetical protein [Limnochordia bacterium]HPZ31553.1 hypothetical protein [Limnochordia bacterium]
MSNSSVFWNLFMQTGAIGLYLLYKYTSGESDSAVDTEGEIEAADMACEGGRMMFVHD